MFHRIDMMASLDQESMENQAEKDAEDVDNFIHQYNYVCDDHKTIANELILKEKEIKNLKKEYSQLDTLY